MSEPYDLQGSGPGISRCRVYPSCHLRAREMASCCNVFYAVGSASGLACSCVYVSAGFGRGMANGSWRANGVSGGRR